MSRYQKITEQQKGQLDLITPSRDGQIAYYPCCVTTSRGETIDFVCLVEEQTYIERWGVWPEEDPAKRFIPFKEIVSVEESKSRIPAIYANQLYLRGEFGMGYGTFTVEFRNGARKKYYCGGLVDFITYPDGLGPLDIYRVSPHTAAVDSNTIPPPPYYWCLYSD